MFFFNESVKAWQKLFKYFKVPEGNKFMNINGQGYIQC